MKNAFLLCIFIAANTIALPGANAQSSDNNFRIEKIGKSIAELGADSVGLQSPIDYFRTRAWVCINGKQGRWADITTSKFETDASLPDEAVDSATVARILSEHVAGIVTYRDSVAAIISRDAYDNTLLSYCWIENGRWVNGGQGLADDEDNAVEVLHRHLPVHYANLPRITQIATVPTDASPFAAFLSGIKESPEEFLLARIGEHKLVINGEIHRRKVSWDMLKRLIALPGFADKAGTVFMELPSWRQATMDEFMNSDKENTELVLEIFRDEQPNGWWDRGEYEFLRALWKLNRSLPQEKRIKVILADYQVPYSKITDESQAVETEERNNHMADVIENHIRSTSDTRNCLFLVGALHAYKSATPPPALAATASAGAQLAARLGKGNVYTVFQHMISGDNMGRNRHQVRGGIFDRAFALDGDRPVGFDLHGSPFGAEPFDGLYEIKYKISTGVYSDNFDGYLFLHRLSDEPQNTPLTEIFTDDFVSEMKRRAKILDLERNTWIWFGVPSEEMTRTIILNELKNKSE